jgi:hypothetical protein
MEMEMTKRNCYVTDVGNAIEALATALDPERKAPFKGDILDLLEWAIKDVLEMRQQLAAKGVLLARATGMPYATEGARAVALEQQLAAMKDERDRQLETEAGMKRQLDAAWQEIAVLKGQLGDGILCHDCMDTGWLENRVEGRYVCPCIRETEPYQELEQRLSEAKKQMVMLRDVIEQLLDDMGEEGHCVCPAAKKLAIDTLAKAKVPK